MLRVFVLLVNVLCVGTACGGAKGAAHGTHNAVSATQAERLHQQLQVETKRLELELERQKREMELEE